MNDDLSTTTQEFMVEMFNVFRGNIQRECMTNCTILSDTMIEIRLKVASDDLTLTWDTDEAYALSLSTKGFINFLFVLTLRYEYCCHEKCEYCITVLLKNNSEKAPYCLRYIFACKFQLF